MVEKQIRYKLTLYANLLFDRLFLDFIFSSPIPGHVLTMFIVFFILLSLELFVLGDAAGIDDRFLKRFTAAKQHTQTKTTHSNLYNSHHSLQTHQDVPLWSISSHDDCLDIATTQLNEGLHSPFLSLLS